MFIRLRAGTGATAIAVGLIDFTMIVFFLIHVSRVFSLASVLTTPSVKLLRDLSRVDVKQK